MITNNLAAWVCLWNDTFSGTEYRSKMLIERSSSLYILNRFLAYNTQTHHIHFSSCK